MNEALGEVFKENANPNKSKNLMNKKLKKIIQKQLEQLEPILEEIKSFTLDTEDSEMWDPDYYYDLAEQLREALALLEDKKIKNLDRSSELEPGICSLINSYAEEKEEDYD